MRPHSLLRRLFGFERTLDRRGALRRQYRHRPALEALEDRLVPSAFVPGSIQGQDNWSGGSIPISGTVDQGVDQTGSNAHLGTGSWRVSNSTVSGGGHNGSFGGWPFAPGLSVAAGQPSSGAGADRFSGTYFFRSANTVADGSNVEIDLGTTDGSNRNTFMAVTNKADVDGGLQLRMAEPNPGDPGNDFFYPTQIVATSISRGTWHRIDIQAIFSDGASNDTFQVLLDGVAITNPTPGSPNNGSSNWGTFEGYSDGHGFSYAQSNRLYFRSGAAPSGYGAFSDTGAQGFYIDDVSYKAWNSSAPSTILASYSATFEPATATANPVYVDDSWLEIPVGVDPDGAGPATAIGYDAFATIQAGIDAVSIGGTVNVLAGTYNESPSITKSLTLQSTAGRDATIINLQLASSYIGTLSITGTGNNVTLTGFTINGNDGGSNVFLGNEMGTVSITDNRFRVGIRLSPDNPDEGIGILTTYDPSTDTTQLTMTGNIFEPLTTTGVGGRAFYINPGVDGFNFEDNQITGNFKGTSITQAKDGLVDGNTVTGNGTSAGLGTWGYPDPDVYGKTTFSNNDISYTQNAITIYETNNVTVSDNTLDHNDIGVRELDLDDFSNLLDWNSTTISGNTITNSSGADVSSGVLQTLINNAAPGATIVIPTGTYSGVTVDKNLTLDGSNGGVVIIGASPALTVTSGQVIVQNGVTFTTATNDPTVLVQNGGDLTLRDCTVEESTGFDQAGIIVESGGLLDLGVTGDLGGNTFDINGAGSFIDNQDDTGISALGNSWQQDGATVTSNFTIEDEIRHALDVSGLGLGGPFHRSRRHR